MGDVWERDIPLLKECFELGDNNAHNDCDDQHSHADDDGRIYEGADDTALKANRFLKELTEAAHNDIKDTACFASAHHCHKQLIKCFWVARQRLRERRTALNIVCNGAYLFAQKSCGQLLLQYAQGTHHREPRLKQRCELNGEGGELRHWNLASA